MPSKQTTEDKSLARLVRAPSAKVVEQLALKARQEGRPNEAFRIVCEMTTAWRATGCSSLRIRYG
jgi:hypothetical protein